MTGPLLRTVELAADGRVIEHRLVDPLAPVLSAADLAATRGDGVFETLSIGAGHAQAVTAHLDRFARSARMLDLPAPDAAGWRDVVRAVADDLAGEAEAWVKICLSRGLEGTGTDRDGAPTGWAWGAVSPDHAAARRDGIRVVILDRGVGSDVEQTSPWLLAGAKTLSYAVNMAAKREAVRRGVDDALFVSSDGYLLEGPTANLVARLDGELVTPPPPQGVLPGTSQGDAFRWAAEAGIPTAVRPIPLADLERIDAAWMLSSVRHAAPVRDLDGRALAVDAELTSAVNAFLLARTE